jgi:hypothetical protein
MDAVFDKSEKQQSKTNGQDRCGRMSVFALRSGIQQGHADQNIRRKPGPTVRARGTHSYDSLGQQSVWAFARCYRRRDRDWRATARLFCRVNIGVHDFSDLPLQTLV